MQLILCGIGFGGCLLASLVAVLTGLPIPILVAVVLGFLTGLWSSKYGQEVKNDPYR